MKFIATLRIAYDVPDEVEANLVANEFVSALGPSLEDGDTVDITQVIPFESALQITPEEMVQQLRRSVDLLIATRIEKCIDVARYLDTTAWVLERRAEETFDTGGYDYGLFEDKVNRILQRVPRHKGGA